MSTTANQIYVVANGHRVALDLDDTELLPSFQANDRTKPDSIQSDYSPEFSVPSTAKNHRLLQHAAASQPAAGSAYVRVPAVLTSGGVETLPLAILLIKGYSEGRYNLQVFGGNKRFIEQLKRPDGSDKTLADLDLSRFDHLWLPAVVRGFLPYSAWQTAGWGYELYDRGKPLDLQAVDPYSLYPSCSAELVWQAILKDAGFTADSLLGEPLWQQLNVPSANPFTFSDDYRDARMLKAGFEHTGNWFRDDEFQELAPFNYIGRKPYGRGALVPAGPVNQYVVTTLGYYDLSASLKVYFGCNERLPGEVAMKVVLRSNNAPLLNDDGSQVEKSERTGKYLDTTLAVSKKRVLLRPGDILDVQVQGDEFKSGGISPDQPQWYIGTRSLNVAGLPVFSGVEQACSFTVELTEEFPPGGLVKLNEWLPDMKQLDFVKAMMLVLGLTIQVDQYTPHLRLAPGNKLLANISQARDWTAKRDAYAVPGRLPERDLNFRFGEYGQRNYLRWTEDEHVSAGYGEGSIAVADEVLPAEYEMATLPFAATEASKQAPGLLAILNFETDDETAKPVVYSKVEAKPRLTLRPPMPLVTGQLVLVPEHQDSSGNTVPAVLAGFTTTASYFDGADLSLLLNKTVLSEYWADLKSLLDEARIVKEFYRLTPQDIASLDYSTPVWDSILGDYYVVGAISEYDARRSVEVTMYRINAKHLPPPRVPGAGLREWYSLEFWPQEWA